MLLFRSSLAFTDAAQCRLSTWPSVARRIAVLIALLPTAALAQTPQSQVYPPPVASEPAVPAKPAQNPGLFDEIGKLLTSPSALLPNLKPAETTPPPVPAPAVVPGEAAKEAPAAGSRFVPGIVSGRELCPRSQNGAPDCKTGSDKLCRANGYTAGKSLDTDAAFACSTKPLQTRGKLCDTETFVIRAFCQ